MAAVFVCTALAAVAGALVLPRIISWVSPLWSLPTIPLAIVTATFTAIWLTRRRTARIQRAVRASSGYACVWCVYDLRGLGDTGACPECGRQFNIAVDRRSWERAKML